MDTSDTLLTSTSCSLAENSYEKACNGSKPYLVPVVFDKEILEDRDQMECERTFACIIADNERPELSAPLESLSTEVCYSTNGRKIPDHVPDECDMVFICEDFEGEVYQYLCSKKFRVLGPPCVLSCAQRNQPLPNSMRPIYSCTMEGIIICFTGFKDKEELHDLCGLVHMMGASIRKEITSSVSHVVAHSVSGSKYKVAVGLGTPIMSEEWVHQCWKNRNDTTLFATGPEMMVYKQLPFTGCHIALLGFSEEETQHMREIAADNGAVTASLGDSGVTHLVVADSVEAQDVPPASSRVQVIKQQWFWESIQIEACADEALYQAKGHTPHPRRLRPRSSLNASLRSMGSVDLSLLEASLFSLCSPATGKGHGKREAKNVPSSDCPEDRARRHITSELLQTEKNFADILNIIVNIFQEPLERPQQRGGPILSHEDSKNIFGNTPEILAVHQRLVASLEEQMANWSETACIGRVLLEQADDFLRVYPPFVNFFEMSKEALHRCDKTYPRFHAFLKANESRPECCRQTLSELLITPVQRIPRIILLLQDLVKHTPASHSDHTPLQEAVESLKTVMNHINEDKRKTEGQMQMFEVLRDVEGCPATVLSSNRTFLRRLDLLDIGNPTKGTKGDPLALFLFSDSMEIARRRPPSSFSIKSSAKTFKHLEFLPFTHVRAVVNFGDRGDFINSFGLLVRWPEDPQEKLLVFRLGRDDPGQEDIVKQIAKLLANTNFSTDPDQFVVLCSSETLNSLCKSSLSSTTLRRALHGASKRVRRAFSGRQHRKSLSSMSIHLNLHGIGEENEPPDSPAADCMSLTSPNTSLSSSAPSLAFTPVASLRTPRAKRPALGRGVPSFSAADLSSLGTEV